MKKATIVGLSLLTALTLGPLSAAAEPTETAKKSTLELVPYSSDQVGGHFQVGLTGAVNLPFGKLENDRRHRRLATDGFGAGLDVGYGVNRNVMLGVTGELFRLGSPNGCSGCTGTQIGGGLFFRYHLAQGLRFDPWISYGLGVQSLRTKADDKARYSSLEWMRLRLGANWSLSQTLGLGPVAEFGAATVLKAPGNTDSGSSHFRFVLGLRLTFDTPGR